jgi:hypothetical protein
MVVQPVSQLQLLIVLRITTSATNQATQPLVILHVMTSDVDVLASVMVVTGTLSVTFVMTMNVRSVLAMLQVCALTTFVIDLL